MASAACVRVWRSFRGQTRRAASQSLPNDDDKTVECLFCYQPCDVPSDTIPTACGFPHGGYHKKCVANAAPHVPRDTLVGLFMGGCVYCQSHKLPWGANAAAAMVPPAPPALPAPPAAPAAPAPPVDHRCAWHRAALASLIFVIFVLAASIIVFGVYAGYSYHKATKEMLGYLAYRAYACSLSPYCDCSSQGLLYGKQPALLYTCA